MTLRRQLGLGMLVATLAASLFPSLASASAPALQLNPLQYEDTLGGTVKNGHVDVSNPTDTTVTINTSVRGFRQQGTHGDLAFYDDADLTAAIKVDLQSFNLGPREAVRVLFSVDPAKLPQGGVYAAIFFSTQPSDQSSASSFVAQSANVGVLLLLHNGGNAVPAGQISNLSLPFWQFGDGLLGSATVANTASPQGGTAFRPGLEARVFPWGKATKQSTGLILPGSTRQFTIQRPGSFLGLLPVTLTDTQTHSNRTVWVFACTGLYSWGLIVVALALLILGILWFMRRRRPRAITPIAPNPEPDPDPGPEPVLLAFEPEPVPVVESAFVEPAHATSAISVPVSAPEPEPIAEPDKPTPTRIAVVNESAQPAPKKRRSKPHRPDPQLRRATDLSPRRPPKP